MTVSPAHPVPRVALVGVHGYGANHLARLVARRDEYAARYPLPLRALWENDSPDTGDDGL